MFDAVRNNKKIVQIFLALITIPFALWGLESYTNLSDTAGGVAAKVGKSEISEAELKDALSRQQEQLREQYGPAAAEIAQSTAFRTGVLDRLINERAVNDKVNSARLLVPDALVRDTILNFQEFKNDEGQFSREKYSAELRTRGMTEAGFEERVRVGLAEQMLLGPIVQSARAPRSVLERWIALQDEEREVTELHIDAKPFEAKVKLAEDAARKYYDANQAEFEVPEQVKVEYVVLSAEDLAKQVKVSDEEARKWYAANSARYVEAEERRASHILITADRSAPKDVREAARKKAEELLTQVRATPADFGKLAKTASQDPSSAANNGDLGYFARGAMVKPFEDATFGLKKGEVSGIVETDFGYHIIQLTDIRGGQAKPFEAARAEIVDELTRQAGSKRYSEAAEQFTNLVYEQSDSLKPAADKLGLVIQKSEWLNKGQVPPGVLGNAKLQGAIFNADNIKDQRNTEAVDVGAGTLVSARVTEHKAAALRPFDQAKGLIESKLLADEATKLAKADGEAKLAQLAKGEKLSLSWGASNKLKRGAGLMPDAQKAVFGAPSDKLPAYVGVASPVGGYSLYRIDRVSKPVVAANDLRFEGTGAAYTRLAGELDSRAYITSLRDKLGVTINAAPVAAEDSPAE
ncbi:MAG: SurA N-terminal domain-containing protein [Moraxellaceae bacterium]|nr:SurA N-terminal domain-containing protein [Moraxellaceae bacterium]